MFRRRKFKLRLASRTLSLGERTLVMGVLNVTPDSFSDGGLFLDTDAAVDRALEIERAGADILDVGAESTRPGSTGISADEELRRILPMLREAPRKNQNSNLDRQQQIRSSRSRSNCRRRNSQRRHRLAQRPTHRRSSSPPQARL